MKKIAIIIVRSIGALTIPYVVLVVIIALGNFFARCSTPWHDGSANYPDGLTLLGSSFSGGVVFSLSSYNIAPILKKSVVIIMPLIFLVWTITVISLFPETTDGFGVFRLCVTVLGMVVGCMIAWKEDCQ